MKKRSSVAKSGGRQTDSGVKRKCQESQVNESDSDQEHQQNSREGRVSRRHNQKLHEHFNQRVKTSGMDIQEFMHIEIDSDAETDVRWHVAICFG